MHGTIRKGQMPSFCIPSALLAVNNVMPEPTVYLT